MMGCIAKYFQIIIDIIRGKRILNITIIDNLLWTKNKNMNKNLDRLKNKIKQGKKIKVYFFVVSDSTFPAASVFEKMLTDNIFDPYVVIIPDIAHGYQNMLYQMDKAYNSLSIKYAIFNSISLGGGGREKKDFTFIR